MSDTLHTTYITDLIIDMIDGRYCWYGWKLTSFTWFVLVSIDLIHIYMISGGFCWNLTFCTWLAFFIADLVDIDMIGGVYCSSDWCLVSYTWFILVIADLIHVYMIDGRYCWCDWWSILFTWTMVSLTDVIDCQRLIYDWWFASLHRFVIDYDGVIGSCHCWHDIQSSSCTFRAAQLLQHVSSNCTSFSIKINYSCFNWFESEVNHIPSKSAIALST